MSIGKNCRTMLVCFALGFGSLVGISMRPEEIEALMRDMNRPKIVHTLPEENDSGEGPPDSNGSESR